MFPFSTPVEQGNYYKFFQLNEARSGTPIPALDYFVNRVLAEDNTRLITFGKGGPDESIEQRPVRLWLSSVSFSRLLHSSAEKRLQEIRLTADQTAMLFTHNGGPLGIELDQCHFHEPTLCAAASMIRTFHDLSAELVSHPAAAAAGTEVLCHNDLSPCNFVFRGGAPVAMIDFDA